MNYINDKKIERVYINLYYTTLMPAINTSPINPISQLRLLPSKQRHNTVLNVCS